MTTMMRVHTFHGQGLLEVQYDGEPHILSRDVGAVLDYSRGGKRLVDNIRGKWSNEFAEDRDFRLVRKSELSGPVSGPEREVMLLTKKGLQLVLMLTRKPAGVAFRRWIIDVLLPAWESGELVGESMATSERITALNGAMRGYLSSLRNGVLWWGTDGGAVVALANELARIGGLDIQARARLRPVPAMLPLE